MIQDSDLLSIQELRTKVELAHQAFLSFRNFSQQKIDAIVEAMGEAGRTHARRLAELAVEETGYGNVTDKIAKNLLNADLLPSTIRGMKTVGVLREIPEKKLVEIAVPMGVIGAILPTTNPTSTAIFKAIISLKAGNAVVLSPHPYARRCTCETIDLLHGAAVAAGAPEGIIQCLTLTSQETTQQLMKHPKIAAILATGGAGLVRAAYSSGKPAFGVGPGNVPVLLDTTANIPEAVGLVVEGKSFDYGTVCSSEQSLVCQQSLRATVLSELRMRKAFVCDEAQSKALEKTLIQPNGRINPACVGKSPQVIAGLAGFTVPPDVRILACEIQGVGKEHPLSAEKLSPVLSLLFVPDFAAAVDACEKVLQFGGLGHTCVIHSHDEARIREYGLRMPAFRVLVNTASPQGSTGITTNVFPSMTLGCGAIAGNITSDNVGPQHLSNIKRIAYVARKASEAFSVPAEALAASPAVPPSPASPAPPASAAPRPAPAVPANAERQVVASAVEQYLASKGISFSPAPLPASQAGPSAPSAAVAASVVDRFLSGRTPRPVPPPNCGCALPSGAAQASDTAPACGNPVAAGGPANPVAAGGPADPAPAAQPKPAPEAPPEPAVDFVCEDDVRMAMAAQRKIRLKPKAILTPSARDLGDRHEIFVR
ncbi:MAG: aldehyde dehydrogenase family protein [Bryobacterales bacterium]|nr:aldehyde dehydrogenase family protein [Bryobacterales bacterium]